MNRAHQLARLNGRILRLYSQRTLGALRAALPMRVALPHLEPVLMLNVGKEVEKDTAVILDAGLATAPESSHEQRLARLLQVTKDIDRRFLDNVGSFPVEIVVRYDEIVPFRTRRIRLLHETASRILQHEHALLRDVLRSTFAKDDFARLLHELLRLYAEEVRSLSRSVRLPAPLVPLREMIARELLDVMLRIAWPLAQEITALGFRNPSRGETTEPETRGRPPEA